MGAKNTTPSSAKRQNKTGRDKLSTQVHTFAESRAIYARNSASVNVHEAVGLCTAPEILLVTSQQSIPEIQPLGNKAIIPEQTVAGYIEKDERMNIKQQTTAEYLGKNNGSTIPQQTVAGYVNSDNTTNTSRQTISTYVEIDDKTTTPQQTSTGCVEKGDAATILLQNISEYVEEDVTSIISSHGGAGYIPGYAGNAISRQTRTKYSDFDNTATSLQQSATEAESIISKTAVVKKEVIDKSKTDQVTSGQQQRDDVSLKLDAAILQNLNHLFKSTVTENMNWETKTQISIDENEVLETERGIEDRDIKIKNKPEVEVSKPENKSKNCYPDLQPFIQETENGIGCAEDERSAPKNEEPSNHISEKILQSTLKEKSMQNLEKTTLYVKKTPENKLVDNENIILAKADATEITITEEEVGVNTAEGLQDDESFKMNEDKDVLKLDQATDNRDECELLGGENADLDPTHFGDSQDRISVSASETVVLGEKYDGETMIFNNREYCIDSSFKRQSDFDSFHKTKFSRESLATRFSIDEGRCKNEKSQTQILLMDGRPQNPNLFRDERPQNPNLCGNERPQNPNLFRDGRPQNPNLFRDERPQNPNLFRDERPQNSNMFRDGRPQNPNLFRDERPQNSNMFRDERPQNPNLFRDERPQNSNLFRDGRPQNQITNKSKNVQNQSIFPEESAQSPLGSTSECMRGSHALSRERSQNSSVLARQGVQRSLMSSQERGHILSMSANDTSKDKNINFNGMVGRSKKENCRPNRVHSKTTEVYVKFAEAIEGNIDILEYIKNRLPPGLEFTVINRTIEQDTKNTIVTLQCKSKRSADRLKAELPKGNHYSQTKILCFDTLQEVRGLVMKNQRDIEISFDQNMQQITWKSESALTEHYDKLSDVESRLEKIQSVKSKFMSFEQFKAQRIEGRALEDKAQELQLQREEFLKQVEYAVRELTKAKASLNFEKIAKETRLNLAIECNRLLNAFPIYARRSDILEIVKNNQVSVIIGETGSGKSTQIAQYIFQGGLANNGIIACTQPRKIAATSLAVHVAKELGTAVGQVVGYKVGMQTKKTNSTKILYLTDHILLNECLQDRKLSAFSCIIIDEAHERSIYTDLLLGMIKECLKDRPDLRLVITSATINPEVFVRYFVECPVLSVSGRMFPVEVEWKEPIVGAESFGNYQEEAVVKAIEVHEKEDKGDILVFLTSPLETEKCCERFRDLMKGKPLNYVTLQLHGRLQGDEQQKVFDPVSGGKRKIVFATNCAETSVTIPGIKYVIDTGLGKEMKFDPVRKMSTLAVSMVTQSSAKQRQGRAGRLGPGKCFRLYTEDDFKKMNVDSLPEIMKVHIGHAMLKLMELGVDPLKFDYIMSPSVPAMEEAFASLVHIGAVSEEKITDLGKWIAKMPFDPKYGAFVYEAVQVGAGVEAVIIAAASGTSSLFYRAGSNEEKEKADKHKIRFCHEGGDQLTLLSVFREWHKVPEKDKGKWCFSYSINGKAIKSVRETTNEVLHTLKKEMKVDLKFSFGRPEELDNLLVGLLFKALNRNLSHYLGHAKAGYSIVSTDQRVEVHPSSALVSLGSQSEWIVFDQVMRTSRDFAMQTTPIPESLVLKGIEEGWLHLQIEEAKKKRITVACQEYVGPQMFREFVGPRYVNMRNLETTLSENFPNSFVVVEADWDKGELKVLSNEKNKECLADSLSQVLAPHRANFQLEESEERIGSMSMDISVRTVIGAGGSIVNVFMPEEFKIVKIFCSLETIDDLSKEDVLIKFGQYGEIKECKKYYRKQKSSTVWGQITFGKTESAVKAVNGTKDERELCAQPNVRLPAHGICGLRTKIQWCRRRSRGFGFVEFANVEDFMAACRLRMLSVGGSTAVVNVAKNSPQSIHVTKFNYLVTEDVLRQAFADALNIDPVKSIVRVNVIREKVGLDKERFSIAKRTLLRKIEEFAQPGTFSLEVREPRSEKDINFIAFCMFNNLDVGYTACSEMNKEFYICNERVSVKVDIHSSLFIRKDIFKISGDAVKEEIQHIENESKEVKIKVKYLKSENVSVEFHTESVNALAQARKRIQVIVRGDIIDCENNDQVRLLFTREGRKMLQTIMNNTGALIVTDDRVMALSIHGSSRSRMNAKADVDEYLQQLSQGTIKYIDLKGTGKPPGVMKALMLKYGTDLYGIQTTANLTTVNLDLRNHRVRVMGSDKAINKAVDIVDTVMKSLTGSGVITSSDDDPDCVTCFCPVESKDLFRLECCGHAYCKECIKLQVDTAITSKDFPIVCGNEGCLSKFVWRDFVNLSRQGHITLSKLVNASLNSYVAQHKNDFHYCTTPDCPIVYRIREGGVPFFCPECNVKVCSSCHVNYHDGLTCIMYKKVNEDDSLGAWLMEDINNRKICPNCSTPIEKIYGCNKMLCLGCKKCLCWTCLKVFNTESECYGHLQTVHGGFM